MISTVRGVRDIFPAEMPIWQVLEGKARQIFASYGYQELRTPIFEKSELFARAVGSTSDIVEKEMYTFLDRGGDSLSLRPEGTAAVVRAFIENSLHRQLPWAVYYMGPMFRYERPQKGRYRQFHQIGCELFGGDGPLADAEMMAMVMRYLTAVGVEQTLTLEINSLGCQVCRGPYRQQLLSYLQANLEGLCRNCVSRLERNPLRILDCKREGCRTVAGQAPFMKDHLCGDCAEHFQGLCGYLQALELPFEVNPLMVRGLDYYNRTAFEVTTKALGAQNAVAAGGRYDGLVESMGGQRTPAIGFAMGLERLALLLQEGSQPQAVAPLYFIAMGAACQAAGMALAERLRDAGLLVMLDPLGGSMKSQMRRADRFKAPFALIFGEREMAENQILVKNMKDGKQHRFSWDEAATQLSQLLA